MTPALYRGKTSYVLDGQRFCVLQKTSEVFVESHMARPFVLRLAAIISLCGLAEAAQGSDERKAKKKPTAVSSKAANAPSSKAEAARSKTTQRQTVQRQRSASAKPPRSVSDGLDLAIFSNCRFPVLLRMYRNDGEKWSTTSQYEIAANGKFNLFDVDDRALKTYSKNIYFRFDSMDRKHALMGALDLPGWHKSLSLRSGASNVEYGLGSLRIDGNYGILYLNCPSWG